MRPMKPATIDETQLDDLNYPIACSPKIDGVRCLIKDGVALSASLKPIPNVFVQEHAKTLPSGLDGELICGSTFQETTSMIMSRDGKGKIEYHVFDLWDSQDGFSNRVVKLSRMLGVNSFGFEKVNGELIDYPKIKTHEDFSLNIVEVDSALNSSQAKYLLQKYLLAGYEGMILRDVDGPYKFGRSTIKEGWLLKIKPFMDSEAEIIGIGEGHSNTNEKKKSELGLSKRSLKQEGLIPNGTLGYLVVEDLYSGVVFNIGTGFDQNTKDLLWKNKESHIGKIVKYKYQSVGVKDKPRLPVFLGFRDELDIG